MKIREHAQRPFPGGFGWGPFQRVRELAEGEAVPEGTSPVEDAAPISDWQPATAAPPDSSVTAAVASPDAATEETK